MVLLPNHDRDPLEQMSIAAVGGGVRAATASEPASVVAAFVLDTYEVADDDVLVTFELGLDVGEHAVAVAVVDEDGDADAYESAVGNDELVAGIADDAYADAEVGVEDDTFAIVGEERPNAAAVAAEHKSAVAVAEAAADLAACEQLDHAAACA